MFSPCFIKSNTLSLLLTMFPLSKLLFTGGYIVLSLSFFFLLFLPLLLLFLLAIGENYIKKIFLFFNILFMDVFTYCLTIRNPKDMVTEKGDKKSPLLFLSIIFLSLFYGEKTKPQ
jgi:archaellum biogenesis protein FlaJ (TadC family)